MDNDQNKVIKPKENIKELKDRIKYLEASIKNLRIKHNKKLITIDPHQFNLSLSRILNKSEKD